MHTNKIVSQTNLMNFGWDCYFVTELAANTFHLDLFFLVRYNQIILSLFCLMKVTFQTSILSTKIFFSRKEKDS